MDAIAALPSRSIRRLRRSPARAAGIQREAAFALLCEASARQRTEERERPGPAQFGRLKFLLVSRPPQPGSAGLPGQVALPQAGPDGESAPRFAHPVRMSRAWTARFLSQGRVAPAPSFSQAAAARFLGAGFHGTQILQCGWGLIVPPEVGYRLSDGGSSSLRTPPPPAARALPGPAAGRAHRVPLRRHGQGGGHRRADHGQVVPPGAPPSSNSKPGSIAFVRAFRRCAAEV